MPGSLQNKLQQFEVTPPPSVWDKITHRLDQEFVPGDSILSSKLNDASVNAPQEVWNRIEAELQSEGKRQKANGKVLPIIKRIAVAAIVAGLISLGFLYFLRGDKIQQPEIVSTRPDTTPVSPGIDESKRLTAKVNPPPLTGKDQNIASIPVKRKTPERVQNTFAEKRSYSEPDPIASPEEAPLYDLNTVSALQPVSVSGPPLRDKSGNLILDLATIRNPDDPYITVTGPNGKQTKISSKFLSCLGYMNAVLSSSEMDSKAIRCTLQFEEWRRRLLSEPAFIPTANNFFDIFELQDMLQEM